MLLMCGLPRAQWNHILAWEKEPTEDRNRVVLGSSSPQHMTIFSIITIWVGISCNPQAPGGAVRAERLAGKAMEDKF